MIFLFPSQSARYPGMLARALEFHPAARPLVERASEVLGRDLLVATQEFADNRDVQAGVFVTNYVYQLAMEALGLEAALSLGASLGEYNHLVHIGALDFLEALRLVDRRGRLYSEGPAGERVTLYPLSLEEVLPLLAGTGVDLAGTLAPRAVLVGGETEAVRAFVARLQAERPKLVARPLGVELPIHCSLFRPVGERFREVLERVPFRTPAKPYLPNAGAALLDAPTREDFVELLARQVYEPVWWRESLDQALDRDPGATLVEVGPGRTLNRLFDLSPDWHPGIRRCSAEDLAEERRSRKA